MLWGPRPAKAYNGFSPRIHTDAHGERPTFGLPPCPATATAKAFVHEVHEERLFKGPGHRAMATAKAFVHPSREFILSKAKGSG